MEDSTFSERLALLPKINTEERTLMHVQGQKSHAKLYASEGRSYMLSWQDERERDDPLSEKGDKNLADIDLGTPILKPRVKNLAKSPKIDEENKKTKTINTVISVKSSDSDSHQQRTARKGKKNENTTNKVDKRKGKSMSSQKKRVNESPSDSSSRLERLKERREKKRAKKAVVEDPKSDKENDIEESRETRKKRKKIPAGFALMHGFTATNVGKSRLTVKPSATIGVFNKGKASRRTTTVKSKGSGKNNHREDCFSESKFLNESKREAGPPGMPSSGRSDASISSGGIAARGPSVVDPSEVKSAVSSKKSKSPSIIEHGNVKSCSASVASYKQGSVVVDTTRRVWANVVCKSDTEKKGTAARPQESCEAPLSIDPSQCMLVPPDKLDDNRSKYFQSCNQPTTQAQDMTKEPLVSLCSFEDESNDGAVRMSMEDQVDSVILPEDACTQDDRVSEFQRELAYGEVMPADVTHDSAQGFAQREPEYDEQMPIDLQPNFLDGDISTDYLPYTEFGDLENLVFDEHQDLQNDGILGQNRTNDAFFIDENSDAAGYDPIPDNIRGLTVEDDPFHGYFNDYGEQGDPEAENIYDYCQAEGVPRLDRDNSSMSDADADSNEEANSPHVDRFYQGRATLLGCAMHESGHQRRVAPNYLASAEVDVVKRLRDHWHPRKL